MIVIDKVMEITEGNYHYRGKVIQDLLGMEMKKYSSTCFGGETAHYIETSAFMILILTKTKSGKNKGSWRIVSRYKSEESL